MAAAGRSRIAFQNAHASICMLDPVERELAREVELTREVLDKSANRINLDRFEIEAGTGRHPPSWLIDAMRDEPATIRHAIRAEFVAICICLHQPIAK